MSGASMAEILETARQQAGLSHQDLWIGYYSIGGRAGPETLNAFLAGSATPEPADYDVIAQALNDRFTDQHADQPVPYAEELER